MITLYYNMCHKLLNSGELDTGLGADGSDRGD